MFKQINLDPENNTFAEIMNNGKSYQIPSFQRDYSWEEEQFNELWQDVDNMHEQKTQHFMGYLVLQSTDGKKFEIIDGQQRLTTITLMIVAALFRFTQLIKNGEEKADNEQRRKHYHDIYLGVFDALKLNASEKLTLNRNNKSHFIDIINAPYQVPRQRNITVTNRKLNKTLGFFNKKVAAYNGEQLVTFIEGLAHGLLFTTITVSDDLSAYLVFETLNARGVHLSSPDLLKNYLLSVMAGHFDPDSNHFQQFNENWSAVLEQLGETNFTAFLRSYHGMFEKLTHKKNLYRTMKRKITETQDVLPYLQDIKLHAATYAALQNPDDSFWREYGGGAYSDCVNDLKTLKIFNIKTPLSLLMSAYARFSAQDFVKIVHWIAIISVRYNVICDKSSNDQEPTYNNLANQTMTDESFTLPKLKEGLMHVYPKDEEFVSAFSTKSMPSQQSAKKIMHLLQQIETHCSGGNQPPSNLTLEHVLPHNPNSDWQENFGLDTYNEAIDRLGNMALLTESQNKNIGQGLFDKKKTVLEDSGYSINQKIAEYKAWDIDNLNAYQTWLAKQAKTVWCIN